MRIATAALGLSLLFGVGSAEAQIKTTATTAPKAKVDSGLKGYTKADVEFISGMIGHHAQAIIMSEWAPTHGASATIQLLCRRIIASQTGEIELMQTWLRDRQEPVPDPLGKHEMAGMSMANMDMPGMAAGELMPGMLTDPQMDQLKAAKGVEFDRLFLTYMLQHHKGALAMTDKLFHSEGAAQDDFVFKFSTGVEADQSSEISRMGRMLDALPPPKKGRP